MFTEKLISTSYIALVKSSFFELSVEKAAKVGNYLKKKQFL